MVNILNRTDQWLRELTPSAPGEDLPKTKNLEGTAGSEHP